jgi:hypothetical protein
MIGISNPTKALKTGIRAYLEVSKQKYNLKVKQYYLKVSYPLSFLT